MPDRILPFYAACDESYSMAGHIDALNDGLRELHHAVGTDPIVAGKTRFCLIGFAGTAEVLLPLSRLSDITKIARLTVKAATRFGTAFDLLRVTIERDLSVLARDRHRVCRPAVFFLSDGRPTDPSDWSPAHARLVHPSSPARPDVVAFGIGDADAATIGRIGTYRAFVSQPGTSSPAALGQFTRTLTDSILRTGTSVAGGGQATLQVSERVTGFRTLTGDTLTGDRSAAARPTPEQALRSAPTDHRSGSMQ